MSKIDIILEQFKVGEITIDAAKRQINDLFVKNCSHGNKYYVPKMVGGYYFCPQCNQSV